MPRSRSPPARSRSPPRTSKPKSGGFRWKDKPRKDEGEDRTRGEDGWLQRGYRHERDGYRERDEKRRERSRSKERHSRRRDEDDDERRARRERKKREREREAGEGLERKDSEVGQGLPEDTPLAVATGSTNATIDDDIAAKFGPSASVASATKRAPAAKTDEPPQRPAAEAAPRSRGPTGTMIVVKINDRLGTTSRIPCLASDTVGDFKKMVAMRIGRKPHEIMLKRQSERPFKDFLTLEDYGVSDGVQLDLELDTGD